MSYMEQFNFWVEDSYFDEATKNLIYEEIDLYEMLKHSAGNYGISDYNATLNLK